ncbi:hypothetical protein HDU67_000038 [Dinochytrium kinnereticum]|nr:hypothetical protein HDU67_000038 [Dinochytrium kinnereticum]
MSNKVLVTGPTGKIGRHLVKELIERGASVRIYVRNKVKAESNFIGLSIEYAEGENEDLTAFAKAVTGIDRLFLVTIDPLTEIPMAKAAVAAGVKHIVKLSAAFSTPGADFGTFFQQHGKAEVDIAAVVGKVALTILRPHLFMDNLLGRAEGLKQSNTLYGNDGTAAISSISARDIASSAAGVLVSPIDLHAGMGYTLTGPEAVTDTELVGILSEVTGRTIRYVDVDESAVFSAMVGSGVPTRYALNLTYLGVVYRKEVPEGLRFRTGWVKFLSGREPQSWREFLEENKEVFV